MNTPVKRRARSASLSIVSTSIRTSYTTCIPNIVKLILFHIYPNQGFYKRFVIKQSDYQRGVGACVKLKEQAIR